ncbi:alpha/beta fold hydrolase [Nocardia heshunensis]
MVPLLAGSHHVVRVDLLGCGESPGLDGTPYTVADQARRLGAVADRLGLETLTAVGHSSGGAVVTALAEQRPALVRAVVIIDFGPDMSGYVAPDIASGSTQASAEDPFRRLLGSAFSPDFEIPQELVDQFRAVDPAVFAEASAANGAYLDELSLPERLAPLGKPLLVIFGEDDSRWRPSGAARYLTVPAATVELLAGVGHSPILEDPARTAALLLAFTAEQNPHAD